MKGRIKMKIKDNKCKCGHDDFFFADKGNQTGIYCTNCGKWLKWADKDEKNLRMKQQVSVLDKIITDIKSLTDGKEPEHIWNVDVLAIIDKYKVESER